MTSSIDAAVEAAKNQAQAPANVPATVTASAAVTPYTGRKLGYDDIIGGGMNVAHYIKATAGGQLQIGSNVADLVKGIRVVIRLDEIQPGFGINYEDVNGQLVYIRTNDGVTTDNGGSWEDALAKARKVKPSIQPYNAWQLPFVLLDDKAGPAVKGDRLGYTTVWSSFNEFHPVFNTVRNKHGLEVSMELEISVEICQNANKKTYGKPKFKLLGVITPED